MKIYVTQGYTTGQQPTPPYLNPAWVKEAKILKLKQQGLITITSHSKDFSDCMTLRSVGIQCSCREDTKNSMINSAQTRKSVLRLYEYGRKCLTPHFLIG
jgi:hypothetical protein